ncbi:hypothetical protein [Acinetobacter higginsii]|uniref:hypothetical protein n=1 Tax=Acinetobacter higginsii TaxID=70347 RepID=UPI001F4B8D1B|nr:hypothetical protein [Acinetobacter higginsii]MCH7295472.1 hypothetical protein [Acinetobacter higginsii]
MASQNPIPTYFNPEIGPQYRGLSFEDVANSFNNGQQFSNQIQQQQQQGLLSRLLAQNTDANGQVDLNKAFQAVQSDPNQNYQPEMVNTLSGLIQQQNAARLKAQLDAEKFKNESAKTVAETNEKQLGNTQKGQSLLSNLIATSTDATDAARKLNTLGQQYGLPKDVLDSTLNALNGLAMSNQGGPEAFQKFQKSYGLLAAEDPTKYLMPDANTVANNETSITNNKLTNQTSRENNQATVGATMRGQDITAQTAAAKLAQDKILAEQEYAFKNGEIKEIMTGTDGKAYAVYRDGRVEPSMLPIGNQFTPQGKINNPQAEELQRISRVDAVLNEIEGILPQSTSSYIGRGADYLARGVGMATSGDIASGKLGTLGGQLVALMPKMSGPQSDKDVAMYKQMAGQLDDATIPLKIRMAALETIRSLNNKYSEMNSQSRKGVPYLNPTQETNQPNQVKLNSILFGQ